MANVLIHTGDESITIPAQAARQLLAAGNGDAALLYMALLRHHGTVLPRALAGELRWDRPRIESAELALRDMGLIAPAGGDLPPEPAGERSSMFINGCGWRCPGAAAGGRSPASAR